MASPFQRYQSGIEASTGNLVQASGQMANQTFNALAGLGQSIGQGIQIYAENQRKSEAADATIASGIARFKSISDVWGQDPEFAPIVAQFAQRLEQYKDAPNQSYAKKAVMANEVNMLGQDLAQTIQAQQVVRGRQIERVGGELLNQFPNIQKVTDPAFIKEGTSKFNTGKDYGSNEGEFLTGLNKFRQAAQAAGKEIKGSDAEALDAYRRDVLDSTNKAMSAGTLDKGVGSRILEQVESQRQNEKRAAMVAKANAEGRGLTQAEAGELFKGEDVLGAYKSVSTSAYQAPVQAQAGEQTDSTGRTFNVSKDKKPVSIEEAQAAGKKAATLEKEIDELFGNKTELSPLEEKKMSKMMAEVNILREIAESSGGTFAEATAAVGVNENTKARSKIQGYADKYELRYLKELQRKLDTESGYIEWGDRFSQHAVLGEERLLRETEQAVFADPTLRAERFGKVITQEMSVVNQRRQRLDDFVSKLRGIQDVGLSGDGRTILPDRKLAIQKELKERIDNLSKPKEEPKPIGIQEVRKMAGEIVGEVKKPAGPAPAPAPVLSLGKMSVGQVEYEKKVNQAEKKAKIADLMTQRIGIVDPATGKKSLPAGFDAYYKKMVPESDARVVDIDGVKLLWDGSKFEQVKQEQPKALTPKEMGENSAYTFGVQTANGIQPTELVPNSGILIGGIVSAASTTVADKVREQLTDMIDLRGSISRLTEINDKFGESLNLRDQGISQYDLMKLRAVLTKQINVSGSISDEERRAINKMTPDPTAFLDLEPKTRAALLGIALGIDRDIKTLATSRGLSVTMTENGGKTQNQSLRQKFLSEKSR